MATIPGLTSLSGAPASGDYVVIHDVSAGSPQDKKITIADLFTNVVQQNGSATLSTATITTLNTTAFAVGASFSLTGNLTFTATSKTLGPIRSQTSSVTIPTLATTGDADTQNITFTGAATTDTLIVSQKSLLPDGLFIQAYVSAANNIQLRALNNTGGATSISGASYDMIFTLLPIT